MFQIGFNEFEGIQVFVFDLSREDKTTETYAMLALGGGVYCTMHTEKTLSVAIEQEDTRGSVQFTEMLKRVEVDRPFILVDSGLLSALTNEELIAVLQHEVGHIVNGDPWKAHADEAAGFYAQQELELAADSYAVGKVGAETFLRSLKKIMGFVVEQVHTVTGNERDEIRKLIENDANTNERFAAIESLL